MTFEITHIRLSGFVKNHESITHYKWRSTTGTGQTGKATLVTWVDDKSNHAVVGIGASRVNVGSVHPSSGAGYLRTFADGQWSNNFLSLPTF